MAAAGALSAWRSEVTADGILQACTTHPVPGQAPLLVRGVGADDRRLVRRWSSRAASISASTSPAASSWRRTSRRRPISSALRDSLSDRRSRRRAGAELWHGPGCAGAPAAGRRSRRATGERSRCARRSPRWIPASKFAAPSRSARRPAGNWLKKARPRCLMSPAVHRDLRDRPLPVEILGRRDRRRAARPDRRGRRVCGQRASHSTSPSWRRSWR